MVDEPALHDAPARGHLSGAVLDTFDTEPLPAESPLPHLDSVTGWCVPQDAQRPVGRPYRLLCPVPRQKSLDRPQEYARMRARVVFRLAFDSARFRQCEINVKGGIGEDIRYGGFPFHRAPPTGIP